MAGALKEVIDLKQSLSLREKRDEYNAFWINENPHVSQTLRSAEDAVRKCFGDLKAEVFRRGVRGVSLTDIYDRDIKTLQAYEDRLVELIRELQ